MTTDPYWDALRAAQSSPRAAELLIDPVMMERLAPQMIPDPSYEPPEITPIEDVVEGELGNVRVRIYQPPSSSSSDPRPLVMWCHGGGWVEFGHDTPGGDQEAIEVCVRLGAVVVSPDYRLAREGVHYPDPVDDILAAWCWSLDRCESWGASPDRTAMGGGSAGANLAAGAALRLRDEGGPLPSTLVLNVPPLHPLLPPLTEQEREDLHLSEEAEDVWRFGVRLGFENYMGVPAEQANIYMAAGVGDPTGLPPTLVIACQYDVLRASARVFAESLEAGGVPHKLIVYPGVGHGHTAAPWLEAAKDAYGEMASWVRGA